MITLSELIKIVENESAMSDKAKDAFKGIVVALAVMEGNAIYLNNVRNKSQKHIWLGAFSKNPPSRDLFSEHNIFPGAANMS